MTITVRGHGITFVNSTNPGVINLPAGSAVGDFAVVMSENGWLPSVPTSTPNWHTIDQQAGTNCQGGCFAKVLDKLDILQGSVSVPQGGSFSGETAIIVFVGGTVSLRTFASVRDTSGAATRTVTTDTTPQTNDYAIYFGSGRGSATVTSSSGTGLETDTQTSCSAVLAGGLLAGSGAVSSTFSFSATPTGDYCLIVILREVAPPKTTLGLYGLISANLTGYDLIATSTAGSAAMANRSASGPFYFEATPTTLTGTPSVGLAGSPYVTQGGGVQGANTLSLAYKPTGAVVVNGVTLSTITTYAQGNRIDCACDPGARLIWFRVAGGNWNNNPSADPASGTGGIDITSLTLNTLFPQVYASVSGNVWSMAFNNFVGTAPSGFQSLDVLQTVNMNSVDFSQFFLPTVAQNLSGGTMQAATLPKLMDKWFSPAGTITAVSGTVMENGITVAGKRVDVYDRDTGELLGTAFSGSGGTWSINCLGRHTVRVVADDPTTYNSLVYDNVVPV